MRPWRRAVQQVVGTGLVLLAALAGSTGEAKAFMGGGITDGIGWGGFGGSMMQQVYRAHYIESMYDPMDDGAHVEQRSWEEQQRAAAIKLQMKDKDCVIKDDHCIKIDKQKVDQYVADRKKERKAREDVEKGYESEFRIIALEKMAEEQGLPGWADAAFVEDYKTYRQHFEAAEAAKHDAISGKLTAFYLGIGAVSALFLGGMLMSNRPSSRIRSRPQAAGKDAQKQAEPSAFTP